MEFDPCVSSPLQRHRIVIGFILPKRSACASRFWKLGYLSRTLSLSLCFPAVRSGPFPHGMVASKTRKCRPESPWYGGLKNVIFDPLIPIMGSFWPALYGSKFHFCNNPPRRPPRDYNFFFFAHLPIVISTTRPNPHRRLATKTRKSISESA